MTIFALPTTNCVAMIKIQSIKTIKKIIKQQKYPFHSDSMAKILLIGNGAREYAIVNFKTVDLRYIRHLS